ncbi:MAG: GntR family transcriptional regulator, partial [Acidimicrobiales bacterium]
MLEREGLVVVRPHAGCAVREFSVAQVRKLYQVRTLFELGAVGPLLERRDENLVERLSDLASSGAAAAGTESLGGAARQSDAFHEAFVCASGNEFLLENWRGVWYQIRLLRACAWGHDPERAVE